MCASVPAYSSSRDTAWPVPAIAKDATRARMQCLAGRYRAPIGGRYRSPYRGGGQHANPIVMGAAMRWPVRLMRHLPLGPHRPLDGPSRGHVTPLRSAPIVRGHCPCRSRGALRSAQPWPAMLSAAVRSRSRRRCRGPSRGLAPGATCYLWVLCSLAPARMSVAVVVHVADVLRQPPISKRVVPPVRIVARCAARWSARASLYSALATPLRNQVVAYASDAYTAQGSVVVVRVVRGSSSREVRRATGQGGIASLWQPRAARAWMRLLRPRVYSAVGPGTECAAVERERQRVLRRKITITVTNCPKI